MIRLLCSTSLLLLALWGCKTEPTTAPGEPGGTAYEPCAGKSCGDECSLCAPDDADCVETAVVKQCNASGTCSSEVAACEGGGEQPEPPASGDYDPCAGKACGESCSICRPDDADCVETMEVKQCDAAGACTSQAAQCG